MSYPQIWNLEKETDRENEKVRDRLAKLNEKESDIELERAIKSKGDEFKKIRNSSSQQGEKRAVLKKKRKKEYKQQNFLSAHATFFFHKTCNEEVSRCNNNGKEMLNKASVLHVQSCCLLIRLIVSLAVLVAVTV